MEGTSPAPPLSGQDEIHACRRTPLPCHAQVIAEFVEVEEDVG
jgi:hypothetical protein